MSSLFGSLQIANNALFAAQVGLQVTSNNISNANTPGYLRQRVVLTPAPPQKIGTLPLGLGVQVSAILQQTDRFLAERLRGAMSELSNSETQANTYLNLEALIGELTDTDLSTSLGKFFAAIQDLLNQPEDTAVRNYAVLEGVTLTDDIRRLDLRVRDIQSHVNDEIVAAAGDINRLLEEIAELNVKIVITEGGATPRSDAVGLRDQREIKLAELAEIVGIRVAEQPSGSVTVFAGGDYLVFEGEYRSVSVSQDPDRDSAAAIIHLEDTDSPLAASEGNLAGLYASRDDILGGFLDDLEDLVRTLAFEFNKVYASGQGLASYASRDYANEILDEAPRDSLLLANWHWATPLWYLQDVEGRRPDIEVRYVFPEGEAYALTWARRVAEGLANGQDVITTNFDSSAFSALPVPEPLGDAFLFRQEPREQLPTSFSELALNLGDEIDLLGYEVTSQDLPLGDTADLVLAWKPTRTLDPSTTLFAHLVAADGRLAGQSDVTARHNDQGIALTQLSLTPFAGVPPGEYTIQIGAYGQHPLLAPDGSARTPVTSIHLRPSAVPPATKNPLQRQIVDDSPRKLVGFDWDSTWAGQPRLYLHWQTDQGYISDTFDSGAPSMASFLGPWGLRSSRWNNLASPGSGHYVPLSEGLVWAGQSPDFSSVSPGQKLTLRQDLQASVPVLSDLVVSVRLIGFEEDGYHWDWWDLNDAVPAIGAIPTLKWIGGSQVRSPHFVAVDNSAHPGQQVGGALTLYDAFTGRTLPILDERLAGEVGWIPLSTVTVAP